MMLYERTPENKYWYWFIAFTLLKISEYTDQV